MVGGNDNFATEDLYNAIKEGKFPSWTFYVQILSEQEALAYEWDVFDVTKIWPQSKTPLVKVGKFTLNRNPTNYHAEVE